MVWCTIKSRDTLKKQTVATFDGNVKIVQITNYRHSYCSIIEYLRGFYWSCVLDASLLRYNESYSKTSIKIRFSFEFMYWASFSELCVSGYLLVCEFLSTLWMILRISHLYPHLSYQQTSLDKCVNRTDSYRQKRQ